MNFSFRFSERMPGAVRGKADRSLDPVTAGAALVDRLVHHSEVLVLRSESYRLKGKGKEVLSDGDDR
jgi:hypothetical protein